MSVGTLSEVADAAKLAAPSLLLNLGPQPAFSGPVLLAYGERDRILPDVAQTMSRVKSDLPQAELHPLPDCEHFLQEDCPDKVDAILAAFLS